MITKQDLERFRELLSSTHTNENGREFSTDEIRFAFNDGVQIWNEYNKEWYWLTEDLQWTRDCEREDLLNLTKTL